jgi:hypothetical protein
MDSRISISSTIISQVKSSETLWMKSTAKTVALLTTLVQTGLKGAGIDQPGVLHKDLPTFVSHKVQNFTLTFWVALS